MLTKVGKKKTLSACHFVPIHQPTGLPGGISSYSTGQARLKSHFPKNTHNGNE